MNAGTDSTGSAYTERVSAAVATAWTVRAVRGLRQWHSDSGFATAYATSRTADCIETGRRWTEQAVLYRALQTAVVYRLLRTGLTWLEETPERWLKHSSGYRWLTADPDPNVIVIDLRKTKTVGPLLRLLERVLLAAVPAVSSSLVWRLSKSAIERLRAKPLRIAGGGLLAVVFVSAFWTLIAGASSLQVMVLIVLAIVGLAAFLDRHSWAELRATRPVQVLAAIFVPPEPLEETSEREGTASENEGGDPQAAESESVDDSGSESANET